MWGCIVMHQLYIVGQRWIAGMWVSIQFNRKAVQCMVHVRLLLLGNYLVFCSCFPLNHLNHFLPINSGTLAFTGPVTQLCLYSVDIWKSPLYLAGCCAKKDCKAGGKDRTTGQTTGPSPTSSWSPVTSWVPWPQSSKPLKRAMSSSEGGPEWMR